MSTTDPPKLWPSVAAVAATAVAVLLSYWVWFSLNNDLRLSRTDPTAWGSFGDYFGGLLNPVVAGFALFWLIRATQVQRAELAEAQAEIKRNRAISSSQLEAMLLQQYEASFFSLLQVHNDALRELNSVSEGRPRAIASEAFSSVMNTSATSTGVAPVSWTLMLL